MGEVRVRATITNALDEVLARRGQLPSAEIRRYEANAVVDTGAVRSIIPSYVAQKTRIGQAVDSGWLNLLMVGKEAVDVTEPVVISVLERDTLEEALVLGDEVLIGQTVLEKLDIMVDCNSNRVVPNPAHPDRPVTKVK